MRIKECRWCGEFIARGRGTRRVYCSDACKQAAYRDRVAVAVAVSLSPLQQAVSSKPFSRRRKAGEPHE